MLIIEYFRIRRKLNMKLNQFAFLLKLLKEIYKTRTKFKVTESYFLKR